MKSGEWTGVCVFGIICGIAGCLVGTMVGRGPAPNVVSPEMEPEGLRVSAVEIVQRLNAVEAGLLLKDEQAKAIVQQLQAVSDAHNRMGNAFAQAGNAQQSNIILMDRAIQRLHGKADWEAAKAGARVELTTPPASTNTPAVVVPEEVPDAETDKE